jgi:predicted lipid-binding transport protein (Tim44 family)
VALLKKPSPPYDILASIPADQRSQYSRCYSARANAAQNKAAFTGGLFGTLAGALFFGGALYFMMSTTE